MYLDLIIKMADFISKKYPEPSSKMAKKKFYKRSAECFALEQAITRCLDNQNINPIDIFDKIIFEYSAARSKCLQQENKYLYLTFINALMDVRDNFS